MAFPPESPQDYCDYFQHLVLYDAPPQPKWNAGLKAAQLWRDYCEQSGGTENHEILVSIVHVLMPFRQRGTGLLDLWHRILSQVAKLPVGTQKEIWLEIFNVNNQGESLVPYNETAIEILQAWVELDNKAKLAPIDKKAMMSMVDRIYRHAYSSYDWISFMVAIGRWFQNYIAEPSFSDVVIDKMRKSQNAKKAA